MAAPSPSLLPGQHPPLFVVSATDKAGIVVNVVAICLVLAVVSLLIRAYVRFGINRQRIAWDDGVITTAVLFCIIQGAIVFYEVNQGLGKAIDGLSEREVSNIQKGIYTDEIFYVLTVWVSKLSATFLFFRLSPKASHMRTSKIVKAIVAVTGIVSILVLTLRCDISRAWMWFNKGGITCNSSMWTHWQAIAAFDIFTEILLACMSVYLVWGLQMSLVRKIGVVLVLDTRLVVIVPIVFHLHYLSDTLGSSDPTLSATYFVICKQAQIAYCIIAANIPSLRPLLTVTATHYGAPASAAKSENRSEGHNSGTYNLRNLVFRNGTKSKQNSRRSEGVDDEERLKEVNANVDPSRTHTSIIAERQQDLSERTSDDSEQMIIRKNVNYQVDYENRQGGMG